MSGPEERTADLRAVLAQSLTEEPSKEGARPTVDDLVAYLDGDLDPDRAAEVRGHLVVSPDLSKDLVDLEAMLTAPKTPRADVDLETRAAWSEFSSRLDGVEGGGDAGPEDNLGRRPFRSGWWAVAASTTLAVVGFGGVAVQHGELQTLRQENLALRSPLPDARAVDLLPRSGVRGGALTGPEPLLPGQPLTLILNPVDIGGFAAFEADLVDSDAKILWTGPLNPTAFGTLGLGLPGGFLPPGDYEIRLHGLGDGERTPLETFAFRIAASDAASLGRFDGNPRSPPGAGDATGRAPPPSPPADGGSEVVRLMAEAETAFASGTGEAYRRAAELYRRALPHAEADGDRPLEGEILYHLGGLYRKYLDEPQLAIEAYSGAIRIFEEIGDAASQSRALNNLGRVHFVLGAGPRAVDSWRRALELKRQLGDLKGEAASLNNLALYHRYVGDGQRALELYDQSLEIAMGTTDHESHVRVLNNRGRLYLALGDTDQALADLRGALVPARRLDRPEDRDRERARVYTAIGRIHELRGDLGKARNLLEQAERLREASGDRRGLAVTLGALAQVYERDGSPLSKADDANRRALEIFRQLEAPRGTATALEAMGRLATTKGEYIEARALFDEALVLFEGLGDPYGEIRTLLGLAAVDRGAGRPRDALQHVEAALGGIEAVRGGAASPHLRAAYLASQQDRYDTQVDLLMELHRSHPREGFDARAFAANERSRARSLMDLLSAGRANADAGAPTELLDHRQRLTAALEIAEQERFRLLERADPGPALTIVEARLSELLRDYRATQGHILAADPAFAALAEPRLLARAEVQGLLDPETLLLAYRLGADRSHLWAVSRDAVHSVELAPRAELESAAQAAYDLLSAGPLREARVPTARALQRLSGLLLSPVADRLAQAKRLAVVADGVLHYLPFAALPRPGDKGNAPLVDSHEVVSLPSASALGALRRRTAARPPPGQPRVAVIADPVFDASDPRLPPGVRSRTGGSSAGGPARDGSPTIPRLPFAGREADAILRLAGEGRSFVARGLDATHAAAVDPALAEYPYLHFATHGILDAERPELTHLLLSQVDGRGQPRRGHLYAHEVYDLHLPVELVTLSSCETALGRRVRGEGLMGLTQGFFHAGAAQVLVSLWRVDDRATSVLMTRFYQSLLRSGESPAASLRQAQRSLRQEQQWRAPYFWAGFVLQGD